MNKIIIILLFPLLCIGQAETKREYYASGRLLSIVNYEDGVRNGSCKYFWDYGAWAIKTDLNYKNGKLIGTSKSYSKQGMLIEEGSYKYTVKGVYSRKDGIWKTYYENGQLKSESIIKDGVEEMKFYDRDGKLQPQNMDGC